MAVGARSFALNMLIGVCLVFAPGLARAAETLVGPVPARIVRVVDGDTMTVRARVWLGQDVEIRVRLAGVDTPELRGRCPAERERAVRARAFVQRNAATGSVTLSDVRYGKYAGRVVARIEMPGGGDLGQALIAANLARPYRGGRRKSWCPGGG